MRVTLGVGFRVRVRKVKLLGVGLRLGEGRERVKG